MEKRVVRKLGGYLIAGGLGLYATVLAATIVDPSNQSPGNEAGTEMVGVNDREAIGAFLEDATDPLLAISSGAMIGAGTGLVLSGRASEEDDAETVLV